MIDKYRLIGSSYNLLTKLYSGNAIQECRLAMLDEHLIQTDSKILFAGSGQGDDAIKASELGAETTLIDISPTMMDKSLTLLNQHPDKDSLNIKTILGDILKHEEKGYYDVVVANFFLTIFEKDKMLAVLDHLIKLCKPGGHIIIGDFNTASGNILQKTTHQAYWLTAATAFFAMTGNPIHSLYDYADILDKKGLKLIKQETFSVLSQSTFQSLLAEKQ
jgi:demethylmenaquinone methyltransferase/2-methoxy-6-polyprenyl-1,4-benzoquinol methylase